MVGTVEAEMFDGGWWTQWRWSDRSRWARLEAVERLAMASGGGGEAYRPRPWRGEGRTLQRRSPARGGGAGHERERRREVRVILGFTCGILGFDSLLSIYAGWAALLCGTTAQRFRPLKSQSILLLDYRQSEEGAQAICFPARAWWHPWPRAEARRPRRCGWTRPHDGIVAALEHGVAIVAHGRHRHGDAPVPAVVG
jgi:hypothetical protein